MIVICPYCNQVHDYSPPQNIKITHAQVYDIIDLCCEYFGVTRTQLFSTYRGGTVTKARHIAMYLIYNEERNGLSLKEIGEFFNRDHSTIVNARIRCRDALFTKQDVYKDLTILSGQVDILLSKLKVAS